MIEVKGLVKTFHSGGRSVTAVDDLDLSIDRGEFVLIKGPSGCGKSTLLFSLGGLLAPSAGAVRIDGKEIYSLSKNELLKYRVQKTGFVFQSYYLLPYLTIAENVLITNKVDGISFSYDEVLEVAKQLHINHRLNHKPEALSVGEKQRASLLRALMAKPEIILADEPTGNLDPENAAAVLKHLETFKEQGGTVVMVTHGADADALATRIITMNKGKLKHIEA
jgi:putative ABC transport system ATP-binding protein